MSEGIEARGCDKATVIQVIRTEALSGAGTFESPVRIRVQYWSFDGKLLATEKEE